MPALNFFIFRLGGIPSKPLRQTGASKEDPSIYCLSSSSVECCLRIWVCALAICENDFPCHFTLVAPHQV